MIKFFALYTLSCLIAWFSGILSIQVFIPFSFFLLLLLRLLLLLLLLLSSLLLLLLLLIPLFFFLLLILTGQNLRVRPWCPCISYVIQSLVHVSIYWFFWTVFSLNKNNNKKLRQGINQTCVQRTLWITPPYSTQAFLRLAVFRFTQAQLRKEKKINLSKSDFDDNWL